MISLIRNLFIVFVAILFLAFTPESTAQTCDAILANGIYDFRDFSATTTSIKTYLDMFCDVRFENESSAESFGSSIGFPFKGIPVQAGFNKDSKSWKQQYDNVCAQHRAGLYDYSKLTEHVKTINPGVLGAFNQCVSTPGLHVWLERISEHRFVVAAQFINPGMRDWPVIDGFNPGPNVKCDGDLKGKAIGGSTLREQCTRLDDAAVGVTITCAMENPVGGGNLKLPEIWHPQNNTIGPPSDVATYRLTRERCIGGVYREGNGCDGLFVNTGGQFFNGSSLNADEGLVQTNPSNLPAIAAFAVPENASIFSSEVGFYEASSSCANESGNVIVAVFFDSDITYRSISNPLKTQSVGRQQLVINEKVPEKAKIIFLLVDSNGDATCDDIVWYRPHFEGFLPR